MLSVTQAVWQVLNTSKKKLCAAVTDIPAYKEVSSAYPAQPLLVDSYEHSDKGLVQVTLGVDLGF